MESNKDAAQAPPAMPRPVPPLGLAEFFRERYRSLIRMLMYLGATREQAEDAVASTVEELLRRWGEIKNPSAYARQAAVHNFFKAKTRYQDRHQLQGIREQCPEPTAASQVPDPTAMYEDHQWVNQLLDCLTPRSAL